MGKFQFHYSGSELLERLNKSMAIFSIKSLARSDESEVKMTDHIAMLLGEWIHISQHPGTSRKVQAKFLKAICSQGLLNSDTVTPLFFRVSIGLVIDSFSGKDPVPPPHFLAIDNFAKLIVQLVLYHADSTNSDFDSARIVLFNRFLSVLVLMLVHSHEKAGHRFNQRPFLRLYSSILNELKTLQLEFGSLYIHIISSIGNSLYTLQPSFVPGFTFGWVQLISHRHFMPSLLLTGDKKVLFT